MLSVIFTSSIIPKRDQREETQPTHHQVVLLLIYKLILCRSVLIECVLVIVVMFSKWVEAYPCRKVNATTVAKIFIIRDVICRYGILTRLSSDRGSLNDHLMGQIVQELCKALQINQHFHCPYHPQSAGAVERQHGTLKKKLAKICEETGLKWPDALPPALMAMRSTPQRRNGLSPHKIVVGRPMRLPVSPTIIDTDGYPPDG